MKMFFRTLGLVLLVGGIVVGLGAFLFLKDQSFLLALSARLVDEPFGFRKMVAAAIGAVLGLGGFLWGAVFLGIAEILRAQRS
ncbi:hypothetical protein ABI59_19510 [Acidobacteria bacterium Mor1]|nr:hypothetical protein ABI59_19510 [Acidobacteria bacterium Mor1]